MAHVDVSLGRSDRRRFRRRTPSRPSRPVGSVVEAKGPLVDSDAEVIVAETCADHDAISLDSAFLARWPSIAGPHYELCRHLLLRPGGCLLRPLPGRGSRHWAALAVRCPRGLIDPGDYASALATFAFRARELGLRTVAIAVPAASSGMDPLWAEKIIRWGLRGFDLRLHRAAEKVARP